MDSGLPLGEGGLCARVCTRAFSRTRLLGILYVCVATLHILCKLYECGIYVSTSEIFHNDEFLLKVKQCSEVTLPKGTSFLFM
jgi:hypothetical protein